MGLSSFTIDTRPGNTTITVDGHDVQARALRLDVAVNEIPTLTISTLVEGVVSGEAHVAYEEGATPGDAVRNIDPSLVRERVANIARTMADDPYAAMLDVVADLLDGQT